MWGNPWTYDELDCLLVPSVCQYRCHFRLDASDWNCQGTPPEIWIVGATLRGTLANDPPDHMQGTMEIEYDHRPANQNGAYQRLTVNTRFDLRKLSPPSTPQ